MLRHAAHRVLLLPQPLGLLGLVLQAQAIRLPAYREEVIPFSSIRALLLTEGCESAAGRQEAETAARQEAERQAAYDRTSPGERLRNVARRIMKRVKQ